MFYVIKILVLVTFSFTLQASQLNQEYFTLQGNSFASSLPKKLTPEVKEEIKDTFIASFLKAYEFYTEEQLKIKFPSKEEWLKETFTEEVQDFEEQKTPINFFLIKHNSKIVAVATTEPEKNIYNCLYIRQMGIDPDYQRQGIGRKMIEIIQQQNPNISSIVLVARIVNQQADRFYKALGFDPDAYQHKDYSTETYRGYRKDIKR